MRFASDRRPAAAEPALNRVRPAGAGRHLVPVATGGLRPDTALARCLDCQVSCQSACKTSCTVGNQRCPK